MLKILNLTGPKLLAQQQPLWLALQHLHVTQIDLAARKGFREKVRKAKVKVEIKKREFVAHNLRKRGFRFVADKHIDDSWKAIPRDNVYPGRYYRWRRYSIEEAISAHRETHHPTIYDVPDSPVNVAIELNMQGEKKTRFVDKFSRIVLYPNTFDHGEERQIMAFVKGEDMQKEAIEAGAAMVGGTELIKRIQSGEILPSDFKYVVAHANIGPELAALKGLLKTKYPTQRSSRLTAQSIGETIQKFREGIFYESIKDENQENYAVINTSIGTLGMTTSQLKDNLLALLVNVNAQRPKRQGSFITRVVLTSPPSKETLLVDPEDYAKEIAPKKTAKKNTGKQEVQEEEEPEPEAEKREQVVGA